MIRNTLAVTKAATFCVCIDGGKGAVPEPVGSGFFVSSDGWFITAAHVLTQDQTASGQISNYLNTMILHHAIPIYSVLGTRLVHFDRINDFALLKADFKDQHNGMLLGGRSDFPFIEISTRIVEEGVPIYFVGYPLSRLVRVDPTGHPLPISVQDPAPPGMPGFATYLSSGVTSAIIAGHTSTPGLQPGYFLDKAITPGNSGGPVVASETGMVFAICTGLQPFYMLQRHLGGDPIPIEVPSAYGFATALSTSSVSDVLRQHGIKISD